MIVESGTGFRLSMRDVAALGSVIGAIDIGLELSE